MAKALQDTDNLVIYVFFLKQKRPRKYQDSSLCLKVNLITCKKKQNCGPVCKYNLNGC